MKTKTTKKAIKDRYSNILGLSYHGLQYLLKYQEPFAYSVRAEGWACDYYYIDGLLVSTGYSPLKDKNVNYNYNTMNKYEEMARDIANNYSMDWELRKEYINILLLEYIREVLKNEYII